jgi:uncharacterized protein YlxW (UPF0749 family)
MPKVVVTEKNINEIVGLIDTWNGKLTWPLLCEKVKLMLGLSKVTRQTLSSYETIQDAFTDRKEHLRGAKKITPPPQSSDVTFLQNQVETLNAELNRANTTIDKYKQRFVLWQYNAYRHGIRMDSLEDALDMLEQPLIELKRRTGGK